MTLSEFFKYAFPSDSYPSSSPLEPNYKNGVIYRLCRLNFGGSSVRNDELKPIFYPWAETWKSYPVPSTSDGENAANPFDFDYFLRSGDKPIFAKLEKYAYNYSTWGSGALPDVQYPCEYPLYAMLLEKKDNWLRIYADLMKDYQPFSNYYLNEEMVQNEKTGSNYSTNASEATSENWSTGTSQDNENRVTETSDTGSVTQQVKGYNSTEFVDSSKSIPNTTTNNSDATMSSSNNETHDNGSSRASGTNSNAYTENKSYLLRYTGALDVNFQEWIKKEIDMRRNTFIQEVVYADIDKYFCRGVY